VDLESLLTSPAGFGLETATLLQRFRCRAKDGRDTSDLVARATPFERRCLVAAIGCDPAQLPVGAPPLEFHDQAPVRTGKSLEMAALAVCRTDTIDVSLVKPGQEPPRISILATNRDNARAVRGHLGIVNEKPLLQQLLVGETDDSVVMRHPSGLPIEIRVIAAHRGGYSIASRWSGSVLFDEAPGWYSTDKIVSLEESREQALGRLLPGAQCIYAGSRWQPSGHCWEAWRDHFGKPTADIVVFAPQEVTE
jgi:hypothetical protein